MFEAYVDTLAEWWQVVIDFLGTVHRALVQVGPLFGEMCFFGSPFPFVVWLLFEIGYYASGRQVGLVLAFSVAVLLGAGLAHEVSKKRKKSIISREVFRFEAERANRVSEATTPISIRFLMSQFAPLTYNDCMRIIRLVFAFRFALGCSVLNTLC